MALSLGGRLCEVACHDVGEMRVIEVDVLERPQRWLEGCPQEAMGREMEHPPPALSQRRLHRRLGSVARSTLS